MIPKQKAASKEKDLKLVGVMNTSKAYCLKKIKCVCPVISDYDAFPLNSSIVTSFLALIPLLINTFFIVIKNILKSKIKD